MDPLVIHHYQAATPVVGPLTYFSFESLASPSHLSFLITSSSVLGGAVCTNAILIVALEASVPFSSLQDYLFSKDIYGFRSREGSRRNNQAGLFSAVTER